VFSPCQGAVEIARPHCSALDVLTIEIDLKPVNAIVTGLTLEMSGNYQFLHSLNDLVYFYAFGDRVGTLSLTGVGFIKPCAGVGGGATTKGSILDLYKYYTDNRAAAATGGARGSAKNIVLTGNNQSIKLWGFLTGMRLDVSDGQTGIIGYWTLRFEVLPQK
jgi:hypothetical protein